MIIEIQYIVVCIGNVFVCCFNAAIFHSILRYKYITYLIRWKAPISTKNILKSRESIRNTSLTERCNGNRRLLFWEYYSNKNFDSHTSFFFPKRQHKRFPWLTSEKSKQKTKRKKYTETTQRHKKVYTCCMCVRVRTKVCFWLNHQEKSLQYKVSLNIESRPSTIKKTKIT